MDSLACLKKETDKIIGYFLLELEIYKSAAKGLFFTGNTLI